MSIRYNLIADIGGTNARFALVEKGSINLIEAKTLPCRNYISLVGAIEDYLESIGSPNLENAVLAVAGVVTLNQVKMTNHPWHFYTDEIRRVLHVSVLKVLNDFTALALAIPTLSDRQILQVGDGDKNDSHTKALIGPGTGLGVSAIIPYRQHWLPIDSEGGHICYRAMSEKETLVIALLQDAGQFISAETLVSGPGLSLLYESLSKLETGNADKLSPEQVSDKAVNHSCPIAIDTLNMFCEILGSVSGDLALTLGARGGVYIGGGIVPQVLDYFSNSNFRLRFQEHGKFSQYLSKIPTYVITSKYPALVGAALALDYQELGVNSYWS